MRAHHRECAHEQTLEAAPVQVHEARVHVKGGLEAPQHEETAEGRVVTGAGGAAFTTAFNNRFAKWRNYGNR